MSKWRTIIAAVDIGNPLFYLIAVGIGIGVLVEQGSGTSGTNGIKYIAFIAPALLANTAITGIMDETVFPTIEGFKWRKLFFAQNSTPITGRQIAIGVYLAALCRAIFSVSVYYILLLAFDVVNFGISILLMPIAVLGGGGFGALMLFAAAKIEKGRSILQHSWAFSDYADVLILWNILSINFNADLSAANWLDLTTVACNRAWSRSRF
jgi:lipooligosaccharide transport system permease protein